MFRSNICNEKSGGNGVKNVVIKYGEMYFECFEVMV